MLTKINKFDLGLHIYEESVKTLERPQKQRKKAAHHRPVLKQIHKHVTAHTHAHTYAHIHTHTHIRGVP